MNPRKIRFFVFAVPALIAASLGACDSGSSDAEIELARQQGAQQAEKEARLKQRIAILKAQRLNESSGQAIGSPGVQPSGGGIPQYREDCGDGVYASGSASCGFSLNIASAYRASPATTLYDIYSPATGLEYTVTCSGGSVVTCTGGRAAVVYFYS